MKFHWTAEYNLIAGWRPLAAWSLCIVPPTGHAKCICAAEEVCVCLCVQKSWKGFGCFNIWEQIVWAGWQHHWICVRKIISADICINRVSLHSEEETTDSSNVLNVESLLQIIRNLQSSMRQVYFCLKRFCRVWAANSESWCSELHMHHARTESLIV